MRRLYGAASRLKRLLGGGGIMEKALSIETVAVEIRVIRVDGHKMTLATFRQIPQRDFFDDEWDKYEWLGWIKAPTPRESYSKDEGKYDPDGRWVLFGFDGTLYRNIWSLRFENEPPCGQIYMAT
jgi:hypothetical protein